MRLTCYSQIYQSIRTLLYINRLLLVAPFCRRKYALSVFVTGKIMWIFACKVVCLSKTKLSCAPGSHREPVLVSHTIKNSRSNCTFLRPSLSWNCERVKRQWRCLGLFCVYFLVKPHACISHSDACCYSSFFL